MKSQVLLYPGMGGWHFVTVGKKQAQGIKARYAEVKRGWGSLPVTVSLGNSTWETSLFPSKEGTYLLALKASVRKAEAVIAGAAVTFSFYIRGI